MAQDPPTSTSPVLGVDGRFGDDIGDIFTGDEDIERASRSLKAM